jgi:hypothetical protein
MKRDEQLEEELLRIQTEFWPRKARAAVTLGIVNREYREAVEGARRRAEERLEARHRKA